jgi:hypothetical protein
VLVHSVDGIGRFPYIRFTEVIVFNDVYNGPRIFHVGIQCVFYSPFFGKRVFIDLNSAVISATLCYYLGKKIKVGKDLIYLDAPFILEEDEMLEEAKHRGKNVKLGKTVYSFVKFLFCLKFCEVL